MSVLTSETPLMPRRHLEFRRTSMRTPQQARTWVGLHFAEWLVPEELIYRAAVVTSELVANACKFGPMDGVVTVSIRGLSGGQVEVAVHDQGRIPRSEWLVPQLGSEHGRGLLLVEGLSSSFDVLVHSVGGKSAVAVLSPARMGQAA